MRVKRGQEDTSVPGGYYKDKAYLEGIVQILQDRKNLDFYGLYCGKMSLEDLKKPNITKKMKKENIKIPHIMQDMEKYMEALDIISAVNHIPAFKEGEGEKWLIILPKLSEQSFCFCCW